MLKVKTLPDILEKFRQVRNTSERICRFLETEDYVIQPESFVSPVKWHLAHTTWFFEAMILKKLGYKSFHPQYDFFFNSYYNSIGERTEKKNRGILSRPTVSEIRKYRIHTDQKIELELEKGNLEPGSDLYFVLELGLNHEQQHQELMIYDIKYILFSNPLTPAYQSKNIPDNQELVQHRFLRVPENVYQAGFNGDGFAWDNERPSHKVYLQQFGIANRLVTNAEFLSFINDKGYSNPLLWLDDGWTWKQTNNIGAPLYWKIENDLWQEYTLSGWIPLIQDQPVCHISFYEAYAFALWAGKRLPTEIEWEMASVYFKSSETGNFLENEIWHPVAAKENSKTEIFQLLGNLWEWTASPYTPYPGYRNYTGALGEYNAKFMINQVVLRGGSCVTPKDHIRNTYRNFFQPEHRWLFSGLRLAE
jgi:ergothioneine biosynthesis protein EgtB